MWQTHDDDPEARLTVYELVYTFQAYTQLFKKKPTSKHITSVAARVDLLSLPRWHTLRK